MLDRDSDIIHGSGSDIDQETGLHTGTDLSHTGPTCDTGIHDAGTHTSGLSHGMGMTHDLQISWHVISRDGHDLGTVKEIRGNHLKVDVSMRPDFWLPMVCIESTTGGEVMLNVDKDHIGDHQVRDLEAA